MRIERAELPAPQEICFNGATNTLVADSKIDEARANAMISGVLKGLNSPINYAVLFWTWDQPPILDEAQLKQVAHDFYIPVSERLAATNNFNVLLGVSPLLLRRLNNLHIDDVARNLRMASDNGTVEIAGTVDATLPLLLQYPGGEKAARRLIKTGVKDYKRIIGERVRTFIPHQLTLTQQIASMLGDAGYDTVVLDSSFYGALNQGLLPPNRLFDIDGMNVVFRSNDWSNRFARESVHNPDWDVQLYVFNMIQGLGNWASRYEWEMARNSSGGENEQQKSGFVVVGYNGEILGEQYKKRTDGSTEKVHPVEALELLATALNRTYSGPKNKDGSHDSFGIRLIGIKQLQQKFGSLPLNISEVSYRSPLVLDSHDTLQQALSQMTGIAVGVISEAQGAVNGNADARTYLEHATAALSYILHPFMPRPEVQNPEYGRPTDILRALGHLKLSIFSGLRSLELSGYDGNQIPTLNATTDEIRGNVKSLGLKVREFTRAT